MKKANNKKHTKRQNKSAKERIAKLELAKAVIELLKTLLIKIPPIAIILWQIFNRQ